MPTLRSVALTLLAWPAIVFSQTHQATPGVDPAPTAVTAPPAPASAAPAESPTFNDEAGLAERLRARLAATGRGAIVVGLLSGASARFVSAGTIDGGLEGRPADADTLFELGSVSKVLTATLFAEMVQRGEVRFDTPLTDLLPAGVTLAPGPADARTPTLADLATHTSGLPRMPTRFSPRDPFDPYADYTAGLLFGELGVPRARAPGVQFEYSNLGVGLLGELLSQRLGRTYTEAVKLRVLEPLSLRDTRTEVAPKDAWRFAQGYNAAGFPAPHWHFVALAGAGGWVSSAKDTVKWLAASISPQDVPLGRAMRETQRPRAPTDAPNTRVGLGWMVREANGRTIIWHNGATGAFHTWVGFDVARRLGVAVLSSAGRPVDDLGLNLLDAAVPVAVLPARPPRHELTLPPDTLDGLTGTYRLQGGPTLVIRREGATLTARVEGQPALPVFADTPRAFYYKVVDAQLDFETDARGRAVRLTLRQDGHATPAERIGE